MGPTFVAILTGEGPGAVAVVRVWGVDAVGLAGRAFRPRSGPGLAATLEGRPRLGRVGDGIGDEVVALVVPGVAPEVEVHAHGGRAAIATVVAALIAEGAERADPSAWHRHSAPSRIRAEALDDLPRAATLRAARHLLDQAGGALDGELALVRQALAARPDEATRRVDRLLDEARVGLRLVPGWRVVLAGRPNVGKSRLLNALVGYDRAIVDPTPGTTRDVVAARTAIDGWPVELADTAGLRATADPIEAAGIDRARASQRRADLVVLVLDRSEPLADQDHALLAEYPDAMVVANKADLPGVWDRGGPVVSAERGDGIEALIAAIGRRLVPAPPPGGAPLPFRPRHVRGLAAVRRAIVGGDAGRADRTLARRLS